MGGAGRAWLIPAGFVVVLVALATARVADDPFGHSHDGRNGATWAAGSRALREDGLVESRLGAVRADDVYANHPPLIYVETAAVEAVLGEHRWVTRSPAYLSSAVAVVLLALLGRRLDLGSDATGWGVAVAVASPMFLGFLAMLDTPMTSFPFGVGLVLCWARRAAPTRSTARTLAFVAMLCALAGWQAAFVALLVTVVAVVTGRRRDGAAVGAGLVAGTALVLAWQLWVFGSLANLFDALSTRSGLERSDIDFGTSIANQVEWLVTFVNPVAVVGGVAGIVLLLRDGGRRREVAIVLSVGVVAYDLLLWAAAGIHEYWSFWAVAPLGLGVARGVEAVAAQVPRARPVALVAMTASCAMALTPSNITREQDAGVHPAELVLAADETPFVDLGAAESWVRYERGDVRERACGGCPTVVLATLEPASSEVLDRRPPFALVIRHGATG